MNEFLKLSLVVVSSLVIVCLLIGLFNPTFILRRIHSKKGEYKGLLRYFVVVVILYALVFMSVMQISNNLNETGKPGYKESYMTQADIELYLDTIPKDLDPFFYRELLDEIKRRNSVKYRASMIMSKLSLFIGYMAGFFTIIGLINPAVVLKWKKQEEKTRKNVLKRYGLTFVISIVLAIIFEMLC